MPNPARAARVTGLFALALSSLASPPTSAVTDTTGAEVCAVVFRLAGEVTIRRDRPTQEITVQEACPLYRNDTVTAGPQGRARITFPERVPLELGPGQVYTVNASPQEDSGGPLRRVWEAILARLRSTFLGERLAPPGASRNMEDRSVPHPLWPRYTAIVESRPAMRWTAVEGANAYLVTLSTYETGEPLWQISTDRAGLAYPIGVPDLDPNALLTWHVRSDLPTLRDPEVVWFRVLSAEEREAYNTAVKAVEDLLPPLSAERYEALGYVAAEWGLYAVAARQLQAAVDAGAGAASTRRVLAEVLGRMGCEREVIEALGVTQRVDPLEREQWEALLTSVER